MGEHLRKARMDRGLYQREVAEEIGVNPDTIKNWEQDHSTPALRHWPKVTEWLGFIPFEVGDSLGERIRTWRTINGVPRSELAARLGVDPSTVWRWEIGETRPQDETRKRVEKIVTLSPDEE